MSFFEKLKEFFNPIINIEPLYCRMDDIFDLIKETVDLECGFIQLVVEYNGKEHLIGVISDYDSYRRKGNGFYNYRYNVDDIEFKTFEEFYNLATIDGDFLNKMDGIKVLQEGTDDPDDIRNFTLIRERYPEAIKDKRKE